MLKPKTLKQLNGNLYFETIGDCGNTVSLVFRKGETNETKY